MARTLNAQRVPRRKTPADLQVSGSPNGIRTRAATLREWSGAIAARGQVSCSRTYRRSHLRFNPRDRVLASAAESAGVRSMTPDSTTRVSNSCVWLEAAAIDRELPASALACIPIFHPRTVREVDSRRASSQRRHRLRRRAYCINLQSRCSRLVKGAVRLESVIKPGRNSTAMTDACLGDSARMRERGLSTPGEAC